MATADPPTPAEVPDPLGRRRCPKCLYDRTGLPAERQCPECGYLAPPGAAVFTLQREDDRQSLWVRVAGIVGIAVFVVAMTGRPGGLLTFVVFAIAAVVVARPLWLALHPEAATPQIWISPAGIGFESEADRSTPFRWWRSVGELTGPAVSMAIFVGFVSISCIDLSGLTAIGFVFAVAVVCVGLCAWGRGRAAVPPADDVAPRMYRWSMIGPVELNAQSYGRATARIVFSNPFALALTARFRADKPALDAIAAEIERARKATGRRATT
jgi:hypothetical protein